MAEAKVNANLAVTDVYLNEPEPEKINEHHRIVCPHCHGVVKIKTSHRILKA